MASLDSYILEPSGKREYLQNYGYHFSKKAYMYAVSKMKKVDNLGNNVDFTPCTNDEVDEMLKRYNIKLKNDFGYDKAYIASMAKADYLNSSVIDEQRLAMFVKDFLDDVDGGKERAFRHWYSDMIEDGKPIVWEDLI